MKSKALVISALFNALLILVACGGHVATVNNPLGGKLHAFAGAMPGFRGLTATKTTAFEFSIVPKVYAATTTTVSFTGSYSGFCTDLNTPQGGAAVLWSGSQDAAACDGTFYTGNSDNSATAAANAPAHQLVIGDGTLGPLVAYADSSTATVHAYVNRGGQILDTGILATLDGKRGTSTTTFPVLDGDTVAVVALSNDGTPSKNLQFVLEKSVP
jgi:hypothetical protein